jgi:hypothetical protein
MLSLDSNMEELADQHISTQRWEHFSLLTNNEDCKQDDLEEYLNIKVMRNSDEFIKTSE